MNEQKPTDTQKVTKNDVETQTTNDSKEEQNIEPAPITGSGFDAADPQPEHTHAPGSKKKALALVLAFVALLGLAGVVSLMAKDDAKLNRLQQATSDVTTRKTDKTANWLDKPQPLGDLKLLKGSYNNIENGTFSYYKVGTTKGGSDLILAMISGNGIDAPIGYFVKTDGKYALQTDELFDEGVSKSRFIPDSEKLRITSDDIIVENGLVEPALKLDKEIVLAKERVALTSNKFYNYWWPPSDRGDKQPDDSKLIAEYPSGRLFKVSRPCSISHGGEDKIPGCTNENYEMWRYDLKIAFYEPRPTLSFTSDVPAFTWNDGKVNGTKYYAPNYIDTSGDAVIDIKDAGKDLVQVGRNVENQPVYMFRNADNVVEKAYYSIETMRDKETYKSLQQYHDAKNVILYKDKLGRYVILIQDRLNYYN